jgi:predicted dithiol-disulfide oxidoreductase (DUF899 family)
MPGTNLSHDYQPARRIENGRNDGDELAQRRQELPWVRLDKEYVFDTDEGEPTLRDLFAGRSQLLVYHFMFGPTWSAGCPTCTPHAESFDRAVIHLNQRNVTMVCAWDL